MDPLALTALISSLLNLGGVFGGGNTQNTQTPATPAGGAAPPVVQTTPLRGAPPNVPNLEGPTQAAGQAAAGTQAPTVEAPAPVPAPGEEEAPVEIGEILAAIPSAIAATGNLLGINDINQITQRAAPIAGGNPGQVVGQFGQTPQPVNIGQLLAALPGVR